ncbi:MAG: ATP-binding cassette domain-containing protein [Deltaproteobacteria bacterium]|nr:ATP-binding cassette domain-containing protein [Deltaproteobacteria bacterium]
MTPVVKVENLAARYGKNIVFEGVSFDVFEGEIFAIVGGNGCGKTTIFKCMTGLLKPSGGRILVRGIDPATEDREELKTLRKGTGVLFQSGALFGSMTLYDNMALVLKEYTALPSPVIDMIIRTKLGMVRLAGCENLLPSELSGGMKKRAGIARAMVMDPVVLFLDEPSAGLDPITSGEFDILIKNVNTGMGTTMIIITHQLESIFNVAHRVIMLDKQAKGIIAEGDPRELRKHSKDPRVKAFFGGGIPRYPAKLEQPNPDKLIADSKKQKA